MAKITFNKLGIKSNIEINTLIFNGVEIEVKKYLPIADKINLVNTILNQSVDEHNFYNPIKIDIFVALGIIFNYTNITFTEKQKEDVYKLYDLLINSGLLNQVKDIIGQEWDYIINIANLTIKAIYEYKNSALGVLETISNNADDLKIDINEIMNSIQDEENIGLVKDIITKLG